jgi:HK97 gp10 family phage protein
MISIDVRTSLTLQTTANRLTPAMANAIKKGLQVFKAEARSLAPAGARRRLQRRIDSRIKVNRRESTVYGQVFPKKIVFYARFVEDGVKPHYAPLSSSRLRAWLSAKGRYRLLPIGQGRYDIYVKGTNALVWRAAKYWHISGRAQPFMAPAFNRQKYRVIRDIENAARQTM